WRHDCNDPAGDSGIRDWRLYWPVLFFRTDRRHRQYKSARIFHESGAGRDWRNYSVGSLPTANTAQHRRLTEALNLRWHWPTWHRLKSVVVECLSTFAGTGRCGTDFSLWSLNASQPSLALAEVAQTSVCDR